MVICSWALFAAEQGVNDAVNAPLEARCRMAYLAGAEEDAVQTLGRALTLEELRASIARYPGDPDEVAGRYERERRGDPPR